MKVTKSIKVRRDTKKVFFKLGTCSRAFFFLLNREHESPHEMEEHAADPLAGGILQQGYQCGMLWGATLALGAESYRKCDTTDQATALSIKATQHVMKSFVKRAKSADCLDITSCDFSSKFSVAKYFFSGKFYSCIKLSDKWAPEAFKSAAEGLAIDQTSLSKKSLSCASVVVEKMGGSDEEKVMVAGFAGGLGLSGGGCGALSAAIWKKTLNEIKKGKDKISFSDPNTQKLLLAFYETTDFEMQCSKITGKSFNTIDEHTEFIENGGCEKLINVLAQ